MKKVALVAGGTGVVGRSLIEHLHALPDWDAYSISQRGDKELPVQRQLSVNLLDPDACLKALESCSQVTHLYYAAYMPHQSEVEEVALNLRMLVNLVQAVEQSAKGLEHIQIMQGSKWYGSHLGAYRTPARESQPRHPQPAFYGQQQDWLEKRQADKSWTWSALRPHGIWGFTKTSRLNPMNAIALYASVMKRIGRPLHFPGKLRAYDAIYQCTDASHLAKGMVWAATSPHSRNDAFNLTNGDFVRWRHLWPTVAEWFHMEAGEVISMGLADFMADKQPLWDGIVEEFNLLPLRLQDLTSFAAAQAYIFDADWDQMSAITKAQLAGWHEVVDTYSMVPRQLKRLVDERVIPDPSLLRKV